MLVFYQSALRSRQNRPSDVPGFALLVDFKGLLHWHEDLPRLTEATTVQKEDVLLEGDRCGEVG